MGQAAWEGMSSALDVLTILNVGQEAWTGFRVLTPISGCKNCLPSPGCHKSHSSFLSQTLLTQDFQGTRPFSQDWGNMGSKWSMHKEINLEPMLNTPKSSYLRHRRLSCYNCCVRFHLSHSLGHTFLSLLFHCLQGSPSETLGGHNIRVLSHFCYLTRTRELHSSSETFRDIIFWHHRPVWPQALLKYICFPLC